MRNISETAPAADRAGLFAICESDLPELSRFLATESKQNAKAVESHLNWFLLENPARTFDSPLGLRMCTASGALIGCILCIPQFFSFQDRIFPVMGSSSFYVDAAHRGSGSLIFLKFSQMGSKWPLFGNSANVQSAALWKARGGTPIPDTDYELFGVLNWSPVVEELFSRKIGNRKLSKLAALATSPLASVRYRLKLENSLSVELFRLNSFEQAADLPIHQPAQKITALRSSSYLKWRYDSFRDSTIALFAARSKRFATDVFVAVNERPRGHRGEVRTLNLLDVYPEVPAEGLVAITSALLIYYRTRIDALVVRGQSPSHQGALQQAGFIRRSLNAHNGWLLDKFKLLPTQNYYFVPGDGDWLI